MPMNVAIYVRVSTDIQAEHGYSLETQLEACRKRAAAIGATTIKEYVEDGHSGAYIDRPALNEMRDAIHAKMYDAVICYDPDRLARKLYTQLILTEEIERNGATPIFVDTEYRNTPEGKLFYHMRGVFAEYEREKIKERTMRGKRGKLKSGKVITDSHIYGYDFDSETCQYTVNPIEADIIKKIFSWYIVERIGGAEKIAIRLSEIGIPSPTGKPQWSCTTIRHILKRPHYTGKYHSNTYYHFKNGPNKETRVPRPKEDWIPMTCPAIITEDMHKKACDLMTNNRTYEKWSRNDDGYLLQGILYCGHCGRRMSVLTSSKTVKYYACVSHSPHVGGPYSCGAKYAMPCVVDEMFWKTLTHICRNAKSLSNYIGMEKKSPVRNVSERDKLMKKMNGVNAERHAVMSWFGQSLLDQETATEKLQEIKAREEVIQAKINALPDEPEEHQVDIDEICRNVTECADDFYSKRNVVLTIIESVYMERTDNRRDRKYELNLKINFK